MSEPIGASDAPGDDPAGFASGMGQRLRQAREAAKLSVEEAAVQLRLSPRQVAALEAEQFDQLPGRTFVRGFVRNYARLLKLDPEPLLAYTGERLDHPVLQPITEGMGVIPAEHAGTQVWQKWAILTALIAALVAGAGYEWWKRQDALPPGRLESAAPVASPAPTLGKAETLELPTPPLSADPGIKAPAGPSQGGASQTPERAQPANRTHPLPQEGGRGEGSSTPAGPSQGGASQAPSAVVAADSSLPTSSKATSAVARGTPGRPPLAAGKIGLLFADLCWVEIRERSGRMLLSQHFSAGQQTLVEGRPPFEITLGNAAMARLSYDGKAIDLAPHTRQNVARLQLP